jgi:RND family efflux transporter MFP subunit
MEAVKGKRLARFLVLVLALAGLAACTTTSGDVAEEPVATAVETAKIKRGNIEVELELTGTVRAQQEVTVTSLLSAKVVETYVQNGDQVKKGDPLFRLDDRDLSYALSQEEKNLEQAQGAYKLAQERISQADSGVKEAQLALQNARNELKRAKLTQKQGLNGQKDTGELTKIALEQAKTQWEEAQRTLERMEALYEAGAVSKQEYEQAVAAEKQARLAYEQAEIDANRSTPPEEKELLAVAVQQAELGVKQAELAVVSAKASRDQARLDAEQARISQEQAKLNVERARQNLDDAVVTAPLSGEVVGFSLEVGEVASPQQPALTIVTPNQLKVEVPVTADRLPLFQEGNEVEVVIPTWGGTVKAEIVTVSRAANESGLFMVEAVLNDKELDEDEWQMIRPGMVAKLKVTETLVKDRWIVPSAAVLESGDEAYVFVADPNAGTARRVDVELIRMETEEAAIEGEFTEGDLIVIRGQHLLSDGDPIRLMGGDAS